ncbi:hypothetical protein M3B68_011475, partial [Micrococcus luteus]|nr:hypothetical protein [Micrococcus luteus]
VFALHMSAATADAVIASMNGRYGLRWATPFDARGAHFMALGHLRTAKNGVPMMFIKDTSHLALSVD